MKKNQVELLEKNITEIKAHLKITDENKERSNSLEDESEEITWNDFVVVVFIASESILGLVWKG